MWRKIASLAFVVALVGFVSPSAIAQVYTYDYDGESDEDPQPADPTDWMTPENWNDGFSDPDGSFGPLVPDFDTRVEITDGTWLGMGGDTGYGTNAPVIGPGDVAEVYELRIGRANGPGTLTMTGGTLDTRDNCNGSPICSGGSTRIRVGNADVETAEERFPGYFNLSAGDVTADTLWVGSGSHGEMTMTGGTVYTRGNFYMDWTSDLTYDSESILDISGGTIHVGSSTAFSTTIPGHFRMYRKSSLFLDGGTILVDGAAELGTQNGINPDFPQVPEVTVNILDGLLESKGLLRIGGEITVDGGILRANSFSEANSLGTIEINGSGLLQLRNSNESVAAVQGLITSGFFTTSSASPLVVGIVNISGIDFTQVSLGVPMGLPGDYNGNDIIDAADYTVWRDTMTAGGTVLENDPTPGTVNESDFTYWRAHFGETMGSGAGVGSSAIPEPASLVLSLMALAATLLLRRSR